MSFLKNYSRILNESYTPTNDDILQLRVVTTAISKTTFIVGDTKLHVFDVSGLKYDRMKWMKYFDIVNVVIYVLSLANYNLLMVEDGKTNQMADSIALFKRIADEKALINCPIIVLLNKKDIYEKKVKIYPIKDYFPDYNGKFILLMRGKEASPTQGAVFFKNKMLKQCEGERLVRIHVTHCTDTTMMSKIVDTIMYFHF
jgi:hypothetical protein